MIFERRNAIDIDRISVASPCSARWDEMHGDYRSRHCDQCDLQVYNISGLTNTEATKLITTNGGRTCIRLRRRTDGTVITKDCPRGLWEYRVRAAKFAGSVFAAILGLFSASYAQRAPANDSQGIRSETVVNAQVVEGVVSDQTGAPIPDAEIKITDPSGRVVATRSDNKGRFRIISMRLDKGKNRMMVSARGFETFVDEFTIRSRESLTYPVVLEVGGFIGVVVVIPEPVLDPRKSEISTTFRTGDNQ